MPVAGRPIYEPYSLDLISYIGYMLSMKDARERLPEWESDLQSEVDSLQKRRDQIDVDLQRASRKLDLVRQMRLLEEGSAKLGTVAASVQANARPTPTSVREMAHKILSDVAQPLHISAIHRQFKERGYAIPGRGTPFNILARSGE